MPPPYQFAFVAAPGSPPTIFPNSGNCLVARNLHLQLSANVHTSRLNWTAAPVAPAKPVCSAEWTAHDPQNLVTAAAVASDVSAYLQSTADILNRALARPPQPHVCFSAKPLGRQLIQAEQMLAQQYAAAFARPLIVAGARWRGDAQSSACQMRCELCASGWVGKITFQKNFSKGGQNYYSETDTWIVGGQAPNQPATKIDIPAQWTATGSGTYNIPAGGSISWDTNANVGGACPPNNVVCVEALTNAAGTVTFHEINNPITVNSAIQVTQTSATGQSATAGSAAGEQSINGIVPNISGTAPLVVSPPGGVTMTSNCQTPPLNPGSSTCNATWTWELALQ